MGKILKIRVLSLIVLFFEMISKFEKNKKIILFGSRNGAHFMDNSRALYEYYVKQKGQEGIYWVTKSNKVYHQLSENGFPVLKINSLKYFLVLPHAKVGFYSNRAIDLVSSEDILPKKLKLIFLGHGQSVKNSRLTVKSGLNEGFKKDILKSKSQIFKAVTSSVWMAEVQSKSHGLKKDDYWLTGFPRNDWFFEVPDIARQGWSDFNGGLEIEKVVLYAPTWRMHGEPTILFPFPDWDASALGDYFEEHKILFLIRPHIKELNLPHNKEKVQKLSGLTPYVKVADNNVFEDVNLLLPFVDLLISDYSSIYHDFLLLEKPLAFVPYDYDFFEEHNGFKYPYFENLPGDVISTQIELIELFDSQPISYERFRVKRESLRDMIYLHKDGNSCERIANEVSKLMDK
jgi:CDP-glycerol glycerophosphotransferase (TagB/SpsB family)